MKLKKEYLILAVVIVALGFYLGLRKSDRTHYELPRPASFSPKKITRIELKSPAGTLELSKKDDAWYLGQQAFPADSKKVEEMLDTLESLKITALVSESGNYVRYDLSEDKKIVAKAWAGDQVKRELEIGKPADTYQHTFIKLPKEKAVYHAQGNFKAKFDHTEDQLRDKKVLAFETDKIEEITIQTGGKSMTIAKETVTPETGKDTAGEEKSDTAGDAKPPAETKIVWKRSDDGTEVKKETVDKLLSSMSNVNCSKYMADSKKTDLKNPVRQITVKGLEESYTLSLYEKSGDNKDDIPGTSSMNDYPFFLPGHQADNIRTPIDELLPPPETKVSEPSAGDKKKSTDAKS